MKIPTRVKTKLQISILLDMFSLSSPARVIYAKVFLTNQPTGGGNVLGTVFSTLAPRRANRDGDGMEGGLETVGRSQRGGRGCGYAGEDTAESLSSSTHAVN